MIRKSLLDLIEVSRSVKTVVNTTCYEVHEFEDGSYVEIRLQKVASVEKLVNLTKGFNVSFHAEDNAIIIRIYENNQGE